jgi:hypothetical protein
VTEQYSLGEMACIRMDSKSRALRFLTEILSSLEMASGKTDTRTYPGLGIGKEDTQNMCRSDTPVKYKHTSHY